MSDKDKEGNLDDLDNLDSSNHTDSNEFDEFDDAMEELQDDIIVDELEEVESNDGGIVSFEETEEDDSPTPKNKSSKARLAILGTVGVIGISGIVFVVGNNLGLFDSSDRNQNSKSIQVVNKDDTSIKLSKDKVLEEKETVANVGGLKVVSDKNLGLTAVDKKEDKSLSIDFSSSEKGTSVNKNDVIALDATIDSPQKKSHSLNNEHENIPSDKASVQLLSKSDIEEIHKRLGQLESINSSIKLEQQKDSDRFDMLISKLNKITDISRENKKPSVIEVDKELPRLTHAEKIAIVGNRERLAGYNVIATSLDGSMSIIRSLKYDKERISVFFKGESIIVSGSGVMKITGIEDSGHLALVGDKYYMDDTYIPFSEPNAKSSSSKSSNKKQKVENSDNEKSEKPLKESVSKNSNSPISTPIANPIKFKMIAKGWKMNGVYTDSYLIESPTGQWNTKVIGDEIPGLGIVQGLDKNGDLIVGEYLIKLVKLPE